MTNRYINLTLLKSKLNKINLMVRAICDKRGKAQRGSKMRKHENIRRRGSCQNPLRVMSYLRDEQSINEDSL